MAEDEQTEEKKEEAAEEEKPAEEGQTETPASPLDEAKEINKKKEELLDREEKLIARKEKLAAEELVGGRSSGAEKAPVKAKLTDEEFADSYMKGEQGNILFPQRNEKAQ